MRKANTAWLRPPNRVDVGMTSLQYLVTAQVKGGVLVVVAASLTYYL